MTIINVKNARSQLRALLARVEAGEHIAIARRGKVVAQLTPPRVRPRPLPSLKGFRASIRITGRSMSGSVVKNREEERA